MIDVMAEGEDGGGPVDTRRHSCEARRLQHPARSIVSRQIRVDGWCHLATEEKRRVSCASWALALGGVSSVGRLARRVEGDCQWMRGDGGQLKIVCRGGPDGMRFCIS
jgi:hypothetical protein